MIPEMIKALRLEGAEEVVVVAGGVIPSKDYPTLKEQGVAAIFGPGTPVPDAARTVLEAVSISRRAK